MFARSIFALVVAAGIAVPMAAQTSTLSGTVVEISTRQPIEGVTIAVGGTTLTARTRTNGTYSIIAVPPGTYTVSARRVGYSAHEFTNVVVGINQTRRLDFELDGTQTLGAVRVEATPPLVDLKVTSSETTLSSEQIMAFPFTSVAEMLAMSPGFSLLGASPTLRSIAEDRRGEPNQVSVRGGRGGATVQLIDGVVVNNPFFGSNAFELNPLTLGSLSFSPGYMEAQYGGGTSGIVNGVLREGGERFEQVLDYQTTSIPGLLGSGADAASHTQLLRGRVSGPVGNIDRFHFSLAGQMHSANEQVLQFSEASTPGSSAGSVAYTGWHGFGGLSEAQLVGKLTYTTSSNLKLTLSGIGQTRSVLPYDRRFLATYRFATLADVDTRAGAAEAALVQQSVRQHGRFINARVEQRFQNVLVAVAYGVIDGDRRTCNVFQGVCMEGRFWQAPQRANGTLIPTVSALVPYTGTGTDFGKEAYTSRFARADVMWQASDHHRLQAGLQHTLHDLSYDELIGLDATVGTVPTTANRYRARPVEMAAFVQNTVEYDFLYATAGLRFDRSSARGIGFADPRDATNGTTAEDVCEGNAPGINETKFTSGPTTGLVACLQPPFNDRGRPVLLDSATRRAQSDDFAASGSYSTISPRLGMSFPLTERSALFVNLGAYVKYPFYHDVFRNTRIGTTAGFGTGTDNLCDVRDSKPGTTECQPALLFHPDQGEHIGNPNLANERSSTFEVGYTGQVGGHYALGVTVYSTDQGSLAGLATSRPIEDDGLTYSPEPNLVYSTVTNGDNVTSRGLSVSFRRGMANHWGYSLNYTWSRTLETGLPPDIAQDAQLETSALRLERISPRDRPHALNAALFLEYGNDTGDIPGAWLIRNSRLAATFAWASPAGRSADNTQVTPGGGANPLGFVSSSAVASPLSVMVSKRFVAGNAGYGLFLRVTNLLNSQGCCGAGMTAEERRLVARGLPVADTEEQRTQYRRFYSGLTITF
jgi:hypothetical protein